MSGDLGAEVVVRAVRRYRPAGSLRLLEIGAAEGRTLVETASAIGTGEYIGIESVLMDSIAATRLSCSPKKT